MPLTPTASGVPWASSSRVSAAKSAHHTSSASCSTQPGCGNDVACSTSARATTVPSPASTRTPFDDDVPMSIPSTSVTVRDTRDPV